jgi:hypothetical protein
MAVGVMNVLYDIRGIEQNHDVVCQKADSVDPFEIREFNAADTF